jgi:uncharacterized protein YraI
MKRLVWSALATLSLAIPMLAYASDGYVTGNVNLRAGPDPGYPLVDQLPAGTEVNVQGCTDGWEWCDVINDGDGSRGWIAGNFIQYEYQDQPVLLPEYGADIGIPIIAFSIGAYWDNYYRGRPFYGDRASWYNRPFHLPPFPADAHVTQSTTVSGKTLKYTVTVGSLPVRDEKGNIIGEVVFTAYTMPGKDRPVTFAVNGGPGASSVYLNFGAIGPKKVNFGVEGDNPSDPATLHDNPGTWLGFTDLVFIDPVGTGYSRALVDDKEATKQFYSTDNDIKYLSRIVYDWLVKNGRMTSRKYLVGESYGGFRGPRITDYLQTQLGVAMNGVVLLSPYLDPAASDDENVSPLPWMLTLPSIAAAHLEREHKLTPRRWLRSSTTRAANTPAT